MIRGPVTLEVAYRRFAPVLAVVLAGAAGAGVALPACARAEAGWRFAPAEVPPPPEGAKAEHGEYGVPVGVVGEISFWAPNRGLLITGGTQEQGGPVKKGLYAWDGRSWHQLATVCGGAGGRIVWAGPDDFWTVSDQRAGQVTGGGTDNVGQSEAPDVSLCHFESGAVVGSYAVPLQEADSWRPLTGGVCFSPSSCWFGGADGVGENTGAFHLHWDGSSVSAVYEPVDHAVTGMTLFQGRGYEGVELRSGDQWPVEESRKHPSVIHTLAASGAEPFGELTLYSEADEELLPSYGAGVAPEALGGLDLVPDAPAGAAAGQLWAVAGAAQEPPHGSAAASLTVLREVAGPGGSEEWAQLLPVPGVADPLAGASLAGGDEYSRRPDRDDAIAPEPGSEDAWLSLRGGGQGAARLVLVQASTCEGEKGRTVPCARVVREDSLPEAQPGETEPVGPRGAAGPVVCPAAHDCWMATFAEPESKAGWLFHYSEAGAEEAPDTDRFFDGEDGVIEYRPPDQGIPLVYPDGFANDDSLANQQVLVEPSAPPAAASAPRPAAVQRARPLLEHVKSEFRHHRTLVISFTLTAKAHVQLIAKRKRKVVAKTRKETLSPGRHELSLTFNPLQWPTKLSFEAHPLGAPVAGSSGGGEGAGGPEAGGDSGADTIGT